MSNLNDPPLMLDRAQNPINRRCPAQRIFRYAKHLLYIRMILHGNVSRGHGPDDETHLTRAVGLERDERLRQTPRAVQRSLTRHTVHLRPHRQMLRERIFDHLHERRAVVCRLDFHFVQKLYHQSRESLVRSGDAHGGMELYQDVAARSDVYLEVAGLVQRAVEQRE